MGLLSITQPRPPVPPPPGPPPPPLLLHLTGCPPASALGSSNLPRRSWESSVTAQYKNRRCTPHIRRLHRQWPACGIRRTYRVRNRRSRCQIHTGTVRSHRNLRTAGDIRMSRPLHHRGRCFRTRLSERRSSHSQNSPHKSCRSHCHGQNGHHNRTGEGRPHPERWMNRHRTYGDSAPHCSCSESRKKWSMCGNTCRSHDFQGNAGPCRDVSNAHPSPHQFGCTYRSFEGPSRLSASKDAQK